MKAELHIPVESFGFVAIELDDFNAGKVAETYKEYADAFKNRDGLDKKSYDLFIDNYLNGVSNHLEDYEKMNDQQKMIVQTIKRSLARIKGREQKLPDYRE